MKYTTLIIIQLFAILIYANAQNNTICAVKYKSYKSNLGNYNYWFFQDKLISSNEANLKDQYMRGFPVLANGNYRTETDTIKYNKEFNEFISDIKDQMRDRPLRVIMKYYNDDILKMSAFLQNFNKNYIVVDTLVKMDSWEILNDTLTFMGYRCQKAGMNYKQDKYYALFTTQLPYNAGPDGFRGLPGLILKVNNAKGNLGFEAIEIQTPYKGVVPKFNDLGETISQKEWLVITNESRKKSREANENRVKQLKKEKETQKQ